MDMSIDNASLAMKIQTSLMKKTMDEQESNIKKLTESAADEQNEMKSKQEGVSSAGRVNLLA